MQEVLDINKEILTELKKVYSTQEKSNIDIIDLKSRLNYLETQFQED